MKKTYSKPVMALYSVQVQSVMALSTNPGEADQYGDVLSGKDFGIEDDFDSDWDDWKQSW